ncbi:MAG: class I SAM-dependent methyltransferase [Desulfovermiculus sp.]
MIDSKDPYARIARLYDPVLQPFMSQMRWETARLCISRGLRSVLDIGCGTGRQCIILHRHGLQVTGMDSSSAMLEVARSKSPPGISYICAQATALSLPDNLFDAVNFSFSLHENPPHIIQSMLREARRVLKPQGMLLIADYLVPKCLSQFCSHMGIAVIERLAGREHFRNYRHFLAAGGVEGLAGHISGRTIAACRPLLLMSAAVLLLSPADQRSKVLASGHGHKKMPAA